MGCASSSPVVAPEGSANHLHPHHLHHHHSSSSPTAGPATGLESTISSRAGTSSSAGSSPSSSQKNITTSAFVSGSKAMVSFLSRRQVVQTTPQLEARMKQAIKAIVADKEKRGLAGEMNVSASFNRIILKFPALRRAFISIYAVFREFDADNSGTIDADELTACMHALGATLDENGVKEMFMFSVMGHGTASEGNKWSLSKKKKHIPALTFKEFLLCLAVGSVLQFFPLLRAYSGVDLAGAEAAAAAAEKEEAAAAAAASTTSALPASASLSVSQAHENNNAGPSSGVTPLPKEVVNAGKAAAAAAEATANENAKRPFLLMQGRHLVNALKLVLEAYILFDADGSGTIDKKEVLAMIDEENTKAKAHGTSKKKGELGTAALLSRQRWEELDWDSDGQITFKEFLFALFTWVGMDDDDTEQLTAESNAIVAQQKASMAHLDYTATTTNIIEGVGSSASSFYIQPQGKGASSSETTSTAAYTRALLEGAAAAAAAAPSSSLSSGGTGHTSNGAAPAQNSNRLQHSSSSTPKLNYTDENGALTSITNLNLNASASLGGFDQEIDAALKLPLKASVRNIAMSSRAVMGGAPNQQGSSSSQQQQHHHHHHHHSSSHHPQQHPPNPHLTASAHNVTNSNHLYPHSILHHQHTPPPQLLIVVDETAAPAGGSTAVVADGQNEKADSTGGDVASHPPSTSTGSTGQTDSNYNSYSSSSQSGEDTSSSSSSHSHNNNNDHHQNNGDGSSSSLAETTSAILPPSSSPEADTATLEPIAEQSPVEQTPMPSTSEG